MSSGRDEIVKRIEFSSDRGSIRTRKLGYCPAFRSCRTYFLRQRPSPFADIEHGQHGEGAVGVLGQTAVANLGKAPKALQDQEGMLDLGAHAGLAEDNGSS